MNLHEGMILKGINIPKLPNGTVIQGIQTCWIGTVEEDDTNKKIISYKYLEEERMIPVQNLKDADIKILKCSDIMSL